MSTLPFDVLLALPKFSKNTKSILCATFCFRVYVLEDKKYLKVHESSKKLFLANLFNLVLLHHIILKQSINNNTVVAKIYSYIFIKNRAYIFS